MTTKKHKNDLRKAMQAVDNGKAHHWETIAAILSDEVKELRKLLAPFAAFACSPPGECKCHNCKARDSIAGAMGD
jgi:hypothetical protein